MKYEQSALNVASQNADPNSVLQFYRAALAFRRAHPALFDGDIEFLQTAEPVLAFRRTSAEESLVAIFNLSPETLKIGLTGDADIGMSQQAERLAGKLMLHASGFAIFIEREENRLDIQFKRRGKTQS